MIKNISGEVIFEGTVEEAVAQKIDLEGADLSYHGIQDMDLSRGQFINVNFTGATFTNVNLMEANLFGANFNRSKLSKVNLTKADLRKANFTEARMTNVCFDQADMCQANLTDAYLINPSFDWTALGKVKTSNCTLTCVPMETVVQFYQQIGGEFVFTFDRER